MQRRTGGQISRIDAQLPIPADPVRSAIERCKHSFALQRTSMNGLAEIVVDYLLTIMFVEGDAFDAELHVRLQESMPDQISPLSDAERKALSQAAQRRLDDIDSRPDEYGYKPGLLVSPDQRAFLSALATAELHDGLEA